MLGWALNEEENIGEYIDRAGAFLRALTDHYELILIDDGSTDRTWDLMTEAQGTRRWLKAYRNERNRGSGYNTKRAISLATQDYVFWQTVDWAYDIRGLAAALSQLKEVDVLQGVRIGTTQEDKVLQYIPPHALPTGASHGAAGEGVAVDRDGNVYAAEGPLSREAAGGGLTKYSK